MIDTELLNVLKGSRNWQPNKRAPFHALKAYIQCTQS